MAAPRKYSSSIIWWMPLALTLLPGLYQGWLLVSGSPQFSPLALVLCLGIAAAILVLQWSTIGRDRDVAANGVLMDAVVTDIVEVIARGAHSTTVSGWQIRARGSWPDGVEMDFVSDVLTDDPRPGTVPGMPVRVRGDPAGRRYRMLTDDLTAASRNAGQIRPAAAILPMLVAMAMVGVSIHLDLDGVLRPAMVMAVAIPAALLIAVAHFLRALRANARNARADSKGPVVTFGVPDAQLAFARMLLWAGAVMLAIALAASSPFFYAGAALIGGAGLVFHFQGRSRARFEKARRNGTVLRLDAQVVDLTEVHDAKSTLVPRYWRLCASGHWPGRGDTSFSAELLEKPDVKPGDSIVIEADPATGRYAPVLSG